MKRLLKNHNAYSLLKILLICLLLYELFSSIFFYIESSPTAGGYLGGTVIVYAFKLLITYTPPGLKYYSGLYRIALYILVLSRIFCMETRHFMEIKERYLIVFVFSITAFIFMVVGIYMGKYERKKK